MKTLVTIALALFVLATKAHALDIKNIDSASPLELEGEGPHDGIIRLQVLLDRDGISTGWIDGYMGPSTENAIWAYERKHGFKADGKLDEKVWQKLSGGQDKPIMQTYTLTEEDVNQKLIEDIEEGDWERMKKLDCLCYHRITEALAEKFHMDEELLKNLNPDADWKKAGAKIRAVEPGDRASVEIAKVQVDKKREMVLGLDKSGKLVWASRAAIGSKQNPSPSGTHEVTAIAIDPTYTWRPENFEGASGEPFTVAAGPNGPVGNVWIDLSKPTFGLHGTPHPEQMNTMASHGCVRMTNWDATELAHLVEPGMKVEFVD